MVKTIKGKADLEKEQSEAGDKLIVIDFFATWCGPCRNIAPVLEKLADSMKDKLVVLKVDIDDEDSADLVKEHEIQVMPTFVFKKRGEHVDTLTGANEARLKALIESNI